MFSESTRRVGIGLNHHARAARVDKTTSRTAASIFIERDGLEDAVFVGLPLVRSAIVGRVLFRPHQCSTPIGTGLRRIVVLPSIDPVRVARRRDLDAADLAVGPGKGPRIWLPVVRPGEADPGKKAVLVVLLPAIDLAVLVDVDAGP